MWLGSATEDRGVGVSRYTVAVTHHISPDLDAERAVLTADLENAGMVDAKYQVTGIGPTLTGRNGGGDLYYTATARSGYCGWSRPAASATAPR